MTKPGFYTDLHDFEYQAPQDAIDNGYNAKIRIHGERVVVSSGTFRIEMTGTLFTQLRALLASGTAQSSCLVFDLRANDDGAMTAFVGQDNTKP